MAGLVLVIGGLVVVDVLAVLVGEDSRWSAHPPLRADWVSQLRWMRRSVR
jgi:hypothetical protein